MKYVYVLFRQKLSFFIRLLVVKKMCFSYIVNMKLSEMQKNSNQNAGAKSATSGKQKSINETYEELKGCSSDDLMQRLAKEIKAQKDSGVFDYDGLRASLEQIKIYLPNATYENMIRIIDSLK